MGGLASTENILEIILSFMLECVAIKGPSTTRELKSMNLISLSSNFSLSMEESGVFIPKLNLLFS